MYSRVDMPPVSELRKTADASLVAARSSRETSPSSSPRAGRRPKSSPPRGATARPTSGASSTGRPTSTPQKKYPVIENIYAGPQGSFVPKSFAAYNGMQAIAELGFIVVQIDGMGTSNRSKAFHDVAGRTWATPASPIASCGTRRSRRSIRTTTSAASASTARRPAGRTRSARCSFTATSTRPPCRRRAATTTGWTRSGGTSSGWAGRSGPQYAGGVQRRQRQEADRASCCSSSASWTPTSIRRRRCRSSTS